MKKMTTIRLLLIAGCSALLPAGANAQNFTPLGTRAAGMGGAFVGVADDASAIYWNPAGLATGSYFSLLLDAGTGEAVPDGSASGSERSSVLFGLSMPALGIGYYRLHTQTAGSPLLFTPVESDGSSRNLSAAGLRVDSLITHHTGVTLVQSLLEGVALGATLKLVRGIAASQVVPAGTAEEALEMRASEILGRASNTFDLDLGLMAAGGPLKIGLTVRNVREPEFETPDVDGQTLALERQARAGLSYAVTPRWLAAADADLLRVPGPFGDQRDVAFGVEGQLARNAFVRSGLRFNTAGDDNVDDSRRASYSVGGSYAVKGLFIDAQFTAGSERAGRGWGIAARLVY